jgi:ABC-type antimicrobial peptide transport system permease subunit
MSVLDPTTGTSAATPRLLPFERPENHSPGMGLGEGFRIALGGLTANKLRSFLTALGIIIGVAAVIVMTALGQGAARANEEAITRMGTNRLFIRPQEQEVRGVRMGAGTAESLSMEDVDLLRRSSRFLTLVAPEYRNGDVRVEYGNENTVTEIYGSTPDYFEVRNLTIEQGRNFTESEMQQKAMVTVLGWEVADALFGGKNPVGKTIRVNGRALEVIGVQKKMGAVPFGNRDDQIVIPITTAMRRLYRSLYVRSISAQCVSVDKMRDAEEEVIRIIGKAHKTKPGDPDPVRIFNQADLLETASAQSTVLTMLLAGIAVVSLIVGGIGVMNIMLVSVTERTREIGIRRAIGAKRKDILYQFLIESVTLCLVGGLLGIGMGIGVGIWMSMPADAGGFGFPMLLSPQAMGVSFASSAVIGIFFGIYPAMRASALDPIVALRHE